MKRIFRNFALIVAVFAASDLSSQITPAQAVADMRRGINMGNTLEPPYEDDWNNPPAEEVYFDLYKEAGFDVVRVPVRWDKHTAETSPFTVSETWMTRVEEVIDWGLSRGLYVVLNAHHEEWIKSGYDNPVYRARFDSIWSQVATRFSNRSEKLLFEILNEPKGLTMSQNNELHQRILNIIRKTNPTRNVIIQGHEWGGANELVTMTVPNDPYLIGSFHSYNPWPFGLEGTGSFGSAGDLYTLEQMFIKVSNWSATSGLPVFLGEFACHSDADYNSRMRHYRAYVNLNQKYGFTPCTWDDGGNFRVLQRGSRTWNEIKDILIYCDQFSPTITRLSVEQDTLISLEWNRGSYDYESITVERKDEWGNFQTVATLSPEVSSWTDANAPRNKNHYYRIVAFETGGTPRHSNPLTVFLPSYVLAVRSCYLGYPHPVPGIIEAEDFDFGGEGLSYHDMDPDNISGAYRPDEGVDIYDINGEAYYIGNAMPGEWSEYTIDVERDGLYRVDVRCSSIFSGGQFAMSIGDTSSDTMEVNSTNSWVVTDTSSFSLLLSEGEQILRFSIISHPQFYIDQFIFSINTTDISQKSGFEQDLLVQQLGNELLINTPQETALEELSLFHITGALAASVFHTAGIQRISSENMNPGIYLVRALSGNKVYLKKIVIQ